MADVSTVFARINGADLEYVDKATGTVVFAFRNGFGSNPVRSAANGLTAHASGGQTNATAITTAIARFGTVATTADSAVLPASVAGAEVTVINAGANSMNVFPATGETINALSANTAFAIAAAGVATFYCAVAGKWNSLLTA